jgi:hypothetical protein
MRRLWFITITITITIITTIDVERRRDQTRRLLHLMPERESEPLRPYRQPNFPTVPSHFTCLLHFYLVKSIA